MESMTGFGESSFTLENVRFFFRARSLNSKFLELDYRIPDSLSWLTPILDTHLRNKFKRGKIEVVLEADKALPLEQNLNVTLVGMYEKLFQNYFGKKKYQLSPEIIATLPGLIEQRSKDWRTARPKFEFYFLRAMLKLQRARNAEGKKTSLWALRTIQKMLRLNRKLRQTDLHLQKKRALKFRRSLYEGMTDDSAGNTRRELPFLRNLWHEKKDEILAYLKSDISEELNRIQVHLTRVAHLFGSKEATGREVEFYLQELLREANTLVSKSDDIEIIQNGIVMKTEIEKLREQARNLE